jgi:hypothetical protein
MTPSSFAETMVARRETPVSFRRPEEGDGTTTASFG